MPSTLIPENVLCLPLRLHTGAEETAHAHRLERTAKPAMAHALPFFQKIDAEPDKQREAKQPQAVSAQRDFFPHYSTKKHWEGVGGISISFSLGLLSFISDRSQAGKAESNPVFTLQTPGCG